MNKIKMKIEIEFVQADGNMKEHYVGTIVSTDGCKGVVNGVSPEDCLEQISISYAVYIDHKKESHAGKQTRVP